MLPDGSARRTTKKMRVNAQARAIEWIDEDGAIYPGQRSTLRCPGSFYESMRLLGTFWLLPMYYSVVYTCATIENNSDAFMTRLRSANQKIKYSFARLDTMLNQLISDRREFHLLRSIL